jgi:hypothetical protein
MIKSNTRIQDVNVNVLSTGWLIQVRRVLVVGSVLKFGWLRDDLQGPIALWLHIEVGLRHLPLGKTTRATVSFVSSGLCRIEVVRVIWLRRLIELSDDVGVICIYTKIRLLEAHTESRIRSSHLPCAVDRHPRRVTTEIDSRVSVSLRHRQSPAGDGVDQSLKSGRRPIEHDKDLSQPRHWLRCEMCSDGVHDGGMADGLGVEGFSICLRDVDAAAEVAAIQIHPGCRLQPLGNSLSRCTDKVRAPCTAKRYVALLKYCVALGRRKVHRISKDGWVDNSAAPRGIGSVEQEKPGVGGLVVRLPGHGLAESVARKCLIDGDVAYLSKRRVSVDIGNGRLDVRVQVCDEFVEVSATLFGEHLLVGLCVTPEANVTVVAIGALRVEELRIT